jgi:hypothetical protein
MWGVGGFEGRWTALDCLRTEIDGPLVSRRPMGSPLAPHDWVAIVGHGGSTMPVLVGSGAPSTAVLRPGAASISGPTVRVQRLLKSKYPQTSCGKAFNTRLLVGALNVELRDFFRKSHFGKIVERAR